MKHNVTNFDEIADAGRKACAGTSLQVVLAVLQLRGDWPAMSQMLGVRIWSHKHHPCLCCRANSGDLKNLPTNVSLESDGWGTWSDQDHAMEIQRCSKVLFIL